MTARYETLGQWEIILISFPTIIMTMMFPDMKGKEAVLIDYYLPVLS